MVEARQPSPFHGAVLFLSILFSFSGPVECFYAVRPSWYCSTWDHFQNP